MSATATPQSSPPTADIVRDVFLWRRKKLSIIVLVVATAIWVVMEVYQFNFITVASWAAMLVVTSLFLWGNMLRLLGKETPNMSGLETAEQSAMEMANTLRGWIEGGVRLMFWVGAEREWYVFAGAEVGLWLLSLVASCFGLLTLLYIGIVVGMSVPAIYVKYEDKMKGYGEHVRVQWRRFYDMVDEKVFRNIKNKVVQEKEKEKKIE